jgi:predicted TPR repeat methyltransferase
MAGTDDDGWLVRGSADPNDVAAYYDGWSTRYDQDLAEWSYRAPDEVARLVRNHAPDAHSILDAGCGTGLAGRALRTAGYQGEIHGRDVSASSLLVAEESRVYASLELIDLQQILPFVDGEFDGLICVGVMTYLPDVEATWREFARVVAPGGVVAVTQRQDFWEPRSCQAVIERLATDRVWEPIVVSGPQLYLPGNDDYTDQIGVHYVAARVL